MMGEIADDLINHMQGFGGSGRPRRPVHDPLYYHVELKFVCMVSTTAKAVRLELPDGLLVWLPRSVCREWGEGAVWVHEKTLKMSLKTAEQKVDPQSLLGDLPDGWNELQDDPNPPF